MPGSKKKHSIDGQSKFCKTNFAGLRSSVIKQGADEVKNTSTPERRRRLGRPFA